MKSLGIIMAISWVAAGLAGADPASSSTPRIAIVSDSADNDLAALVTSELSTTPSVSLVERDDLAKIGDEGKLQQMANTDAVALGKTVGADGLIFINTDLGLRHVRFTAVGLGYALLDDQADASADLPQLAKALAHRISNYAPKLKLDPAKAIPISVLNLRADYATPDAAALERKLTLLLESRLAALPQYVVLERRHAWSLGFERDLTPAAAPLFHGAYVVDGTMTPPAQAGGNATIHLRVRSPDNQQSPLEIQGPASDLNALAEQMATEIEKATGATGGATLWQPQKEAREYLLEGIWGYQHNADAAALEALDSAELLGETAPDLFAARISVLCRTILGSSASNIFYSGEPIPDDPNPGNKIDDWNRAVADETRYEKEGMEARLEVFDHFHSFDGRTGELHKMVNRTGCALLTMLARTGNAQADEQRSALRTFLNFDPQKGKLPGDWETTIDFADDLSTSQEEEVAYYRGIMTTYPFADFGAWRLVWKLPPDHFCARFISSPADRSAAYFSLFHDLINNPISAPLSLYLLASQAAPADKDATAHALYDYLWDHHEDLVKTKHLTFILKYAWQLEQTRRVPVADPKLVLLLHYYLQNDNSFTGLERQMWIPPLFPPGDAPGLLADLQGYEKRDLRAQHPGVYREMETTFANQFPNASPASPALPPLVVTRFWCAKDAPRRLILGMGALCPAPDGLWLAGILDGIGGELATPPKGVLYHLGIDAAQPDAFGELSPKIEVPLSNIQKVIAVPGALYVLGYRSNGPQGAIVERYDLASGQWVEHDVPAAQELFEVGGKLYLTLQGFGAASRESGIARYDGDTGEMTLLASSRRRPAQNQFDDRANYQVRSIFPGPEGKPCASIDFKNYVISEQPGPWTPVTEAGLLMNTRTEDSRTLLYGPGSYVNTSDAAVMIDSAKTTPVLWLGPITPLQRDGAPRSEKLPLPALPGWATQSLWQQAPGRKMSSSDYGFRGDDLFSLVTNGPQSKIVTLNWYRRGKAEPISIPLHFKMDDATQAALKAVISADSNTFAMVAEPDKTPYVLMMTVIPQGICFKGLFQGFWFLPFSDIDVYLKAAPN